MKESSDGETLMAVGIWFQIWGAAEEKARRPKSVLALLMILTHTALPKCLRPTA